MEKKGGTPHLDAPPVYRFDIQPPEVSNQQNNQHQPTPTPSTVAAPKEVYVVTATPAIGPKPVLMPCPSCHVSVLTRVEYVSTTNTHLCAGLLCLLGGWCCVCIPYCVDSCQNANHYCPNCSVYIGTYDK